MRHVAWALVLVGCGGASFDAFNGVDADGGPIVEGDAGGEASAVDAPPTADAGAGGDTDAASAGGTMAGGRRPVGSGGRQVIGGGTAAGGAQAAGGDEGAGGTSAGGAAAGGAGAGGASPVDAGKPALCCDLAGERRACADAEWLCSGAQTYSCEQDGRCRAGDVCYLPGGPYGGVVTECD